MPSTYDVVVNFNVNTTLDVAVDSTDAQAGTMRRCSAQTKLRRNIANGAGRRTSIEERHVRSIERLVAIG
jgi:hypothetical protein